MAPVSLLTCEVLIGGERGGAAAVFPHDGGTKAGMAWHEPPRRPKLTLTRLIGEKGSKNGAATRFAGIGVATAVNPTTAIREMWLTSGRSRPTKGWRRRRSLRQTWGRSEARRGREELTKLSAAMAMALSPTKSRKRGRNKVGERWVCAGRHGIHDDVIDLTSRANAGVRAPNGSQVSRWVTTTASSAPIQTKR